MDAAPDPYTSHTVEEKNKTGCLAQDTYCTRSSSMCTYGRAYCSVDYYVTWLSPHARTGSGRMAQRVPRFRFAPSALRAFSLGSPMPRQVFNVSVVAFATCTHRLLPHGATRTSIPLRSISVVAFATCAKKRKGLLECKHSSALSSFFPRVAQCLT